MVMALVENSFGQWIETSASKGNWNNVVLRRRQRGKERREEAAKNA